MTLLQNGDKIGPYTIRDQVGQGGMATVYQAWHEGLHRFEALKVPRGAGGGGDPDSAYIQRLLAEARVAAGLQHPHIVGIHSVSEPLAPIPFFAMDWVEGEDLAKILAAKRCFSLDETIEILEPVADALDYAHSRGVVHRDIKPANILIENKGGKLVPRVVDFGISRAAEDEEGATKLTKSGMIVGTPEYMSPEQAGSGEVVDYRTDGYSLAVVAYEMLCGGPPFTAGSGVSRLSILISHVRDVAPLFEKCPDFPPLAGQVLLRALSKSPTERPTNCREFLAQLKAGASAPFRLESSEIGAASERERTPFDESRFDLADDATLCEPPPTPLSIKPVAATATAPSAAETALEARSNATYSLRARLENAPTPLGSPQASPTHSLPISAGETVISAALQPTIAPTSITPSNAPVVVKAPNMNATQEVATPTESSEAVKAPKVALPVTESKPKASKVFKTAALPAAKHSAPRAKSRIAVLAAGCGLVVGAALVFVILGRNPTPRATAESQTLAPKTSAARVVEAATAAPISASKPEMSVENAPVRAKKVEAKSASLSRAAPIAQSTISRPLTPKIEPRAAPKIEPRVRPATSQLVKSQRFVKSQLAPSRAARGAAPRAIGRRTVETPREVAPREVDFSRENRRVEAPSIASRPRIRRAIRRANRPAFSTPVQRLVERTAPKTARLRPKSKAPRVVNVRRDRAAGRRSPSLREAPLPP